MSATRRDLNSEKIEIRFALNYAQQEREILAGGETDPNQTADLRIQWQPKVQHIFIQKDGIPAAHAGLVRHTVAVGERLVTVAGIGGVLTRPDCRGRGFGQMAMQEAEGFALREMNADFGLLFCRMAMCEWYERQGWSHLSAPVWFDQPQGSVRSPLAVMVKSFGPEPWPCGAVRLGSLPW
jgi:GNAT superfamily N-acetyltransferase